MIPFLTGAVNFLLFQWKGRARKGHYRPSFRASAHAGVGIRPLFEGKRIATARSGLRNDEGGAFSGTPLCITRFIGTMGVHGADTHGSSMMGTFVYLSRAPMVSAIYIYRVIYTELKEGRYRARPSPPEARSEVFLGGTETAARSDTRNSPHSVMVVNRPLHRFAVPLPFQGRLYPLHRFAVPLSGEAISSPPRHGPHSAELTPKRLLRGEKEE